MPGVVPAPVAPAGISRPDSPPGAERPEATTATSATGLRTTVIPNVQGLAAAADLAAVLSALALAGLHPSGTASATAAPPTLLERLAALPRGTPPPSAPPAADQDPAAPPPPPVPDAPGPPLLTSAHLALAREIAAPIVFPPADLPDYDRVFALPLMAQGQPTPARVAVATRQSANGTTTTFLRVDCELSRLGSVSVRMSGGHGGPMAITVFAGRRGAPVIAAGLPALMADLKGRGFDAAVRIVQEDQP